MARWRKVEVKTWGDDKFRRLTPIPPCGQGLWMWLLTGPRTTNIPGIVIGTDVVMAAELRWPLEAFREAFGEAFREGMAKGCWEAGLVWLPNAAKVGEQRNKPESPNVIRSWRDTWDEIPECRLKLEAWHHLKAFAEAFGEGFAKAFGEACRQPSVKALPNQEQEQEQELRDDGKTPDPPPLQLNGSHRVTPAPGSRKRSEPAPQQRGTRIPDDFQPDLTFAVQHISDIDAVAEAEKFRDYWKARPGREALKLDWAATWRTWIRNARQRGDYQRRAPDAGGPVDLSKVKWQ